LAKTPQNKITLKPGTEERKRLKWTLEKHGVKA
jgi:hypothetical protein